MVTPQNIHSPAGWLSLINSAKTSQELDAIWASLEAYIAGNLGTVASPIVQDAMPQLTEYRNAKNAGLVGGWWTLFSGAKDIRELDAAWQAAQRDNPSANIEALYRARREVLLKTELRPNWGLLALVGLGVVALVKRK